MRKIENWETVKESSEFAQLVPGPQICKIINVEDIADKEYLKVYFDIVGTDKSIGMKPETVMKLLATYPELNELVGEFKRQEGAFGNWPSAGITYRSYKDSAAKFFKAFTTAVEKSNRGYAWAWDEKSLIGKYVVVNFGEEEYAKDGEVSVSTKAREFRSIEALVAGEVKLLPVKKLPNAPVAAAPDNSDLPW